MKRLLLITVAVLFVAGSAFAEGGNLGIYPNATAANCAIVQAAANAQQTMYIVHKNHTGTTAVGFAAPLPECAQSGMFWITDQNPGGFVIIPNDTLGSQSGISVGYGTCRTDAIVVITMLFQRTSLLPGCCLYSVTPNHLLAPTVQSVDCSTPKIEEVVYAGSANLRPTGTTAATCPCNIGNEPSTWGVIKELFRKGS
jgi:hypothetical protein